MIAAFNASSDEIKVAHLRIGVVDSLPALPGYLLLNRLTLTQLSKAPAAIAFADDQLEVRQFCQAAAQEGSLAIEANAFGSACQFAHANASAGGKMLPHLFQRSKAL